MKEYAPYRFNELFSGNWKLFQEALKNPQTIFVYDNDGIISNTAKLVYERFNQANGTSAQLSEITSWNYLAEYAKSQNLSPEVIKHAEDDFYNPSVLRQAERLLYIKPVIKKTIDIYGASNNYILTSRNPELWYVTRKWFKEKFPEILPKNILIRKDGDKTNGEDFKVQNLSKLASKTPWIVFIDDASQFVNAVLKAQISNCLVVNIPQGKIMPETTNEHLFVIKRYPDSIQAMYPLMDAIDRALNDGYLR